MTYRLRCDFVRIFILALGMFLLSSVLLRAQTCSLDQIANEPGTIRISIFPERISDINEAKNTFEITYYLLYEYSVSFVSDRDCFFSFEYLPENIFDPQLEIMKSEHDEFLSNYQIYLLEETLQVERRVRSTIINSFDFRNFPFDQQSFDVHIMALYSNDTLSLHSYPIDTDSFSNMGIEGWLKVDTGHTRITEVWDGSEFDKLVFSINLERDAQSIFFRIMLPIIAIIFICWASCILPYTDFETIIQLQSATLIALIAFNIVIEDRIPNLPYMTTIDILSTFGFLSNVLLILFTLIRQRLKT